jgi:argininosuccinate synthase
MSTSRSCVLAYSGGLDTSAIIPWLVERGSVVHALLVDVGQGEDLPALCRRAVDLGARDAVVHDARARMARQILPAAIGLAATYEGTYRLGTALARPFIAAAQVQRAREVGATALVHGATGKGNDQVRFEYAYRSLAPDLEVIAPWKVWELRGRSDLLDFLDARGHATPFARTKDWSLDENLWHLSVEGGPLEDPRSSLDVTRVLGAVADRFHADGDGDIDAEAVDAPVELTFAGGMPVALDGEPMPLLDLIATLNRRYRHASWAWDLVLENRFIGVKSRGVYLNPAASVLHRAVDGLARSCLPKSAYDGWRRLGEEFAGLVYRGEWFSPQRRVVLAAAAAAVAPLSGSVELRFVPQPHVTRIAAPGGLFTEEVATFEASDFSHTDAEGFIRLSWLSAVGRPEEENGAESVEAGDGATSGVRSASPVPPPGLVPSLP